MFQSSGFCISLLELWSDVETGFCSPTRNHYTNVQDNLVYTYSLFEVWSRLFGSKSPKTFPCLVLSKRINYVRHTHGGCKTEISVGPGLSRTWRNTTPKTQPKTSTSVGVLILKDTSTSEWIRPCSLHYRVKYLTSMTEYDRSMYSSLSYK